MPSSVMNEESLRKHFKFRKRLLQEVSDEKQESEIKALRENDQMLLAYCMARLSAQKKEPSELSLEDEHKNCVKAKLLAVDGDVKKKALVEKKAVSVTKSSTNDAKRTSTESKNTSKSVEKKTPKANKSITTRLRAAIMFDLRYSVPGMFGMIVYCLSHMFCYDLFWTFIAEPTRNFNHDDLINITALLMGFLISRLSGGSLLWTSDERQEELEQLKNKENDGFRMLNIFKKHRRLRELSSVVYMYLVYASVGYFYQRYVVAVVDDTRSIRAGLPSAKHGVNTYVSDLLLTSESAPNKKMAWHRQLQMFGLFDDTGHDDEFGHYALLDETTCESGFDASAGTCSNKTFVKSLTQEDEKWLYSHVSLSTFYSLMGEAEAPVVTPMGSFVLYLVGSVAGLLFLEKMGLPFWDDE